MATAALADPDDRGYRVPNGHLPPPGECRVWLPDRPPGQQPPPTSCRQAEREAYRHGGRVIYGGSEGRDDRYYDDDDFRRDRRDGRRDDGYANAGGVLRDPDLRRWAFRNFDRNRDGRIGRAEADEANVAFFRYADRNRDGRISATEFSDARARLAG
jgi:hypothetical protein